MLPIFVGIQCGLMVSIDQQLYFKTMMATAIEGLGLEAMMVIIMIIESYSMLKKLCQLPW